MFEDLGITNPIAWAWFGFVWILTCVWCASMSYIAGQWIMTKSREEELRRDSIRQSEMLKDVRKSFVVRRRLYDWQKEV